MKKKILSITMILFLLMPMFIITPNAHYSPQQDVKLDEMSTEEIEMMTNRIAEKYIGDKVPGATIAIIANNEIALLKGYGVSDIEANSPISPTNTIMEAGSVSKLFVWTAIMQLVEQEKIHLDDDIREYLPNNFLDLSFDTPITITHLLTHTAGFEERSELMYTFDTNNIIPLEEYVSKKYAPKQIYAPGTIVSYSNYGTDLAGYIIECISGQLFHTYMEEHIFKPIKMNNSYFVTDYSTISNLIENKSTGYVLNKQTFIVAPAFYVNDAPAGALQTTAEDMALFMLAHMNKENNPLFENPKTLEQMHSTLYSLDEILPVNAHGFWEGLYGGKRTIGHGGNTPAFTANFIMETEQANGVIVLTNVASESSGLISELTNTFIGTSEIPIVDFTKDSHTKDVVGDYRSSHTIESKFPKMMFSLMANDYLIKENNRGGITLSVPSQSINIDYVEVSPYLFVRVDNESTIFDRSGINISRLYFIRDGLNNVTSLSFGSVDTSLKISFWQTQPFTLGFLIISLTTFIIGIFLKIFVKIKKRKLSLPKYSLLLSILGFAQLFNIAVQLIRFLASIIQPYSTYLPHIIISMLIVVVQAVTIAFTIVNFRKDQKTTLQKIYTIILCVMTVANFIFLYYYNFFYLG